MKQLARRKPQQRARAPAASQGPGRPPIEARAAKGGGHWLWGRHAVLAALGNRKRRLRRLLLSEDVARRDGEVIAERTAGQERAPEPEIARRGEIEDTLASPTAVHQGYALETLPLEQPRLEDVARGDAGRRLLVCLDQASDPANIGAVLRSAAAFGAAAVVTTQRHAPGETGAMAKSASGAMECMPYVQVPNLAQALENLKKQDYWCIGLASTGAQTLAEASLPERLVLVMGAEGQGLRRLTRERCDLLLSLPTPGPLKELNLSVATAVALYELLARQH